MAPPHSVRASSSTGRCRSASNVPSGPVARKVTLQRTASLSCSRRPAWSWRSRCVTSDSPPVGTRSRRHSRRVKTGGSLAISSRTSSSGLRRVFTKRSSRRTGTSHWWVAKLTLGATTASMNTSQAVRPPSLPEADGDVDAWFSVGGPRVGPVDPEVRCGEPLPWSGPSMGRASVTSETLAASAGGCGGWSVGKASWVPPTEGSSGLADSSLWCQASSQTLRGVAAPWKASPRL